MPKLKKFMLKVELKDELLHGLETKYNLNKDKLKGTLVEVKTWFSFILFFLQYYGHK